MLGDEIVIFRFPVINGTADGFSHGWFPHWVGTRTGRRLSWPA